MTSGLRARLADWVRLVRLSAHLVAGRRFWIAPLLPLLWPAFQAFRLLIGWREDRFEAVAAQGNLIGFPLVVLAVGLGVRVIAGEMDRRTLEIAYTVPGGSHRVWLAKLAAVVVLLAISEALLAAVVFAFFTSFPLGSLYGALQAAVFYAVAAAGLAALFKSEVAGAMGAVAVLVVNAFVSGFGENQVRISPFFNPLAVDDASPADLLAWTVQNRIGFLLAIAAVMALAFSRAERREKLLGG